MSNEQPSKMKIVSALDRISYPVKSGNLPVHVLMCDNGLVDMHLHCTCAKVVILGPSIVDRSNLLHLESGNDQQQKENQNHRCLPKHLPAIQVFRLIMFY